MSKEAAPDSFWLAPKDPLTNDGDSRGNALLLAKILLDNASAPGPLDTQSADYEDLSAMRKCLLTNAQHQDKALHCYLRGKYPSWPPFTQEDVGTKRRSLMKQYNVSSSLRFLRYQRIATMFLK